MFRTRIHGDLETIQEQLRGWQTSVPARARRFQALRGSLEEQARKLLGTLVIFSGNENLQRLKDRTERLGTVAGPLETLIRDAERLDEEVRLLLQRARTAGGSEVVRGLEQRCRDWSILLGSLGADCDRESELQRDQQRFRETEEAVRLHEQAVTWLLEARRVLSDLGSDLKATSLAADLPGLELRLMSNGASLEWLREIRMKVEPLKDLAQRLQDPPQELKNVSLLLTDLRGWSRELKDKEKESRIEQLEQSRFKAMDWSPADLDGLAREAETLRDQLVGRARDLRIRKLADLRTRVDELVQACGYQPELHQRMAELEMMPFDRSHLFREWASRFKRVEDYFQAIANTHEGALERRLSQLVEEIGQGLGALRSQPLSDQVRSEADALEHDLRELAGLNGAEPMLGGLGRSSGLKSTLDRLLRQARKDSEDLSRRQETLRETHQDLQLRAREAGLNAKDLSERIEDLSHGKDEPSLERARQLAAELSAELDRQRDDLLAQCRSRLDQGMAGVRATVEALRRTGTPFTLPELPVLPDGASPGDAVRALQRAEEAGHLLQSVVEKALRTHEERRLQARFALQHLRPESLGPDEQETVSQLLQELDEGSWAEAGTPVERFELLSQLIEKCDLLFERLNQEERSARSRYDDLRRRLRRHIENELRRFSPDLTDRVSDLIFGIPSQPASWRAVQEQLNVAERLLVRVEAQSARLAADELHRAVETLRGRRLTAEAQGLLDSLKSYSDEELPPVVVRTRLVNAARHAAEGDPRP